jgi:hypothetical protein
VFGADVILVEALGLFARQVENLLRAWREVRQFLRTNLGLCYWKTTMSSS